MVGQAFATDLLRAPPLPYGVDELDPIGVDHPKHGWSSQEGPCPVLMGLEEAEEPGALGETRKQGPIVARQPAMERPVADAFEGMQHPQGDYLTGPEVRLGVFGYVVHLPIDVVEQGDDKIPCSHAALLLGEGRHADQHGRVVGRRQAQKGVILVCKDLYICIVCQRLAPSVTRVRDRGGARGDGPPVAPRLGHRPTRAVRTLLVRWGYNAAGPLTPSPREEG